jgi:hypothetical protein
MSFSAFELTVSGQTCPKTVTTLDGRSGKAAGARLSYAARLQIQGLRRPWLAWSFRHVCCSARLGGTHEELLAAGGIYAGLYLTTGTVTSDSELAWRTR